MKKNKIILVVVALIILAIGSVFLFSLNNYKNNKTKTTEELTNKEVIEKYMKEETTEVFSKYYELVDFEISNYEEKNVDGNVEAIFLYTLTFKNFDKDPDTVGYIKEAKESGNENYQQMYDEYLEEKQMNFNLKVVIDEEGNKTLYSDIAQKGDSVWEKTEMEDYILR